MSAKQDNDDGIDHIDRSDDSMRTSAAFEYVIGTLRGEERKAFERQLNNDDSAKAELAFWEERFTCLNTYEERAPASDTLVSILNSINTERETPNSGAVSRPGFNWLQWLAPTAAAVALMLVMIGYYPRFGETVRPNTDYVAVLVNESGKALVSALTVQDDKKMWLKWETSDFSPETSRQLWAISKRDGEARPIVVLDRPNIDVIDLTTSTWRLITDAAYLILTEEEAGGSAIDEPSDTILAKGVCVRFSPSEKTI